MGQIFARKVSVIILFLVKNILLVTSQNNTLASTSQFSFQQSEVLEESSGLRLEWNVSLELKLIRFTISIQTNETYVAIGLTKKGRVRQGDDVIAIGVGNNGSPFVLDMVAQDERTVVPDISQDWQIVNQGGNSVGSRRITILRNLETCDEQDYIFNSNLIHVVWGYQSQNQTNSSSSSSQLQINFRNESRPIYFLDPVVVPSQTNVGSLQTFRISRRFRVPSRHTTYWCTIHRVNATFNAKHHIIGFAPYFDSELGNLHIHHQIVYRCTAPPGMNPEQYFEPFISHPGEECYLHQKALLPSHFCRETIHEWAVNGKSVIFPDNVGFPIGHESRVEYFLYETHYNNPQERSDLDLETGVDFVYTSQLRQNDGGILLVGYGVLGNWVMPPQTTEFDIAGHCNSFCTTRMFLPDGVDVLGIRLHGHLSSRRLRIKHYRRDVELPWIHNDDNYDFNFQQWRWLYNSVRIQPGDQITVQCGYDNTWKNDSSATVSGFSTGDEMCHAWLLLSKNIPFQYCSSEYPTDRTLSRLGIQNMAWEVTPHDRVIQAATNPINVGLTLTQMVTNIMTNWTTEQILALENEQLYSAHASSCPNVRLGPIGLHALSLIQQALPLPRGVGLPLPEFIRNTEITLRTISTPVPTSTVSYIRSNPPYSPPSSCPGTSGSTNVGNQINGGVPGGGGTPSTSTNIIGGLGSVFREVVSRVGSRILPLIRLPFT